MSTKSIAAYEQHRSEQGNPLRRAPSVTPRCFGSRPSRRSPTLPPPSGDAYRSELRSRAAELRAIGARILTQASELDESADRLEACNARP